MINHDYVYNAAKKAKEEGVKHFSLITSNNSAKKCWVPLLKWRGLVEEKVISLQFPAYSNFKPGLLMHRPEERWFERLFSYAPFFTQVHIKDVAS